MATKYRMSLNIDGQRCCTSVCDHGDCCSDCDHDDYVTLDIKITDLSTDTVVLKLKTNGSFIGTTNTPTKVVFEQSQIVLKPEYFELTSYTFNNHMDTTMRFKLAAAEHAQFREQFAYLLNFEQNI